MMLPWDYLMLRVRRKPRCPACGMRHGGPPNYHNEEFDRVNSAIGGLEIKMLTMSKEEQASINGHLITESLTDLRAELNYHRQYADPAHVAANELPS